MTSKRAQPIQSADDTAKPLASSSPGRSGGPRTEAGKSKSSMNALRHGATSPRLLNAREQKSYAQFLTDLRKHYKSSHPLVNMQLERIARLRVQLERVQGQMDSLHRVATKKSDTFDLAAQALGLNEVQTQLAGQIMQWLGNSPSPSPDRKTAPLDRAQVMLILELENFKDDYWQTLRSHDDFVQQAPKFCEYITGEANARKLPLNKYLRLHRPPDPAIANHSKPPILNIQTPLEQHNQGAGTEWQEAKITDVSVNTLQIVMGWFYHEALTYLQDFEKASPIKSLMNEVEGLALPESADIERLMRYQTTLQRQLSSAMGELLALVDRETRG